MSLFITFEGPEGSGKSTQARCLYQRLEAGGYPVMLTREPGGTIIGDQIRRILLDMQHGEMDSTTETLLFSAARAQLVAERIRPHLQRGGIVVCDRFADSTYAYQGYGLGRDLQELHTITRIATGGLEPDVTIYLDLPVAQGLNRKRATIGRADEHVRRAIEGEAAHASETALEWNRLDAREIAFHERVRRGYHTLIAATPQRWLCLDAHLDRDTLATRIWQAIEPRIKHLAPLQGTPV